PTGRRERWVERRSSGTPNWWKMKRQHASRGDRSMVPKYTTPDLCVLRGPRADAALSSVWKCNTSLRAAPLAQVSQSCLALHLDSKSQRICEDSSSLWKPVRSQNPTPAFTAVCTRHG